MKKIIIGQLALFTFLILSEITFSQEIISETEIDNFSLYNTKAEYVTSEIVADSFFILVSVPDGYNSNNTRYPVLYALDGDIAYGMASSISRYLQIGDNIPELIVVGVGYGKLNKSIAENRRRDLRPTQSNGAENFLKFLNEELIPYIDTKYRTIPGERTINGFSIAGLFCLYTLFNKPESFNRYIVGSPNLNWEDYSIFKYEESSPQKIGDLSLSVFISVGSEESEEKFFNPIDSLVTNIQQHNYPGLTIETKVFDGSIHLVGPPESLTHGLISVFRKEEY